MENRVLSQTIETISKQIFIISFEGHIYTLVYFGSDDDVVMMVRDGNNKEITDPNLYEAIEDVAQNHVLTFSHHDPI